MKEILFIRHAQAEANIGNFAAFGNKNSPLTAKGHSQCEELRDTLASRHGITPEEYDVPVAASEYLRPQETAQKVGFLAIDILSILNEPDFSEGSMVGAEIVSKHTREHWAPEAARRQARQLIDLVCSDDFPYQLVFTHGMFTATVLLEQEKLGYDMSSHTFDSRRGYVPLQAAITTVKF